MVLDTTRHVVLDDDLVTAGRNAGYVITFYFVALYFDSKGHALFAHCHWMDRRLHDTAGDNYVSLYLV